MSNPFVYSQKHCSLENSSHCAMDWMVQCVFLSVVIEYLQLRVKISYIFGKTNTKGNLFYFLKRHKVKLTKTKRDF